MALMTSSMEIPSELQRRCNIPHEHSPTIGVAGLTAQHGTPDDRTMQGDMHRSYEGTLAGGDGDDEAGDRELARSCREGWQRRWSVDWQRWRNAPTKTPHGRSWARLK